MQGCCLKAFSSYYVDFKEGIQLGIEKQKQKCRDLGTFLDLRAKSPFQFLETHSSSYWSKFRSEKKKTYKKQTTNQSFASMHNCGYYIQNLSVLQCLVLQSMPHLSNLKALLPLLLQGMLEDSLISH